MILLGVAVGGCLVGLYLDFRYRLKDMEKRLAKLEADLPKRLPYKTADAIEDAEAALIKFIREVEFNKSILDNALAHLQHARNPGK